MEKIKRYKLKPNTTKEQLISLGFHEGGTWVHKNAELVLSKYIHITNEVEYTTKKGKRKKRKYLSEFNIGIVFTDNINDWNDFDNVLVLDEDWCQPYYPFYHLQSGKIKDDEIPKVLPLFVTEYNKYMDSLEFLEEIK